jgi:hypothetical protein
MNSPYTGEKMTRATRQAEMTIRGVVVKIEEECWTCAESGKAFTDEAMMDRNFANAWAAYWRMFPVSDLLTMRETAVRDIKGIDHALAGAKHAEKAQALELKIDRDVLARFERGEYSACFPHEQWWWHGNDGKLITPVSEAEFAAIKRLTDMGFFKKETR